MKVLQINSVHYGSTGNIMRGIDALAKKQGIDSYISFPNGRHNHLKKEENHVYIGGRLSEDFHLLLDRITGLNGYFSILSTKRFLKQVDGIKPDIIHIHNLHNCYINLRMLFDYIKQNDIRTVWTLHDCWSMTGHCPHFMYPKCDRWRTGCYQCGRYKEYPKSFVDTSGFLYKKKREWFTEVKNMTVVTPSKWLADIVRSSYLKGYETRIIHNGTDLNVFRTVKGNFRKEYGLEDKKLILCVADDWNVKSKGLETVYGISTILPEDYRIILVGELSSIDKQDSDRILYLGHTESREKLAEIYSAVDVLFNPTREEVFGLVNVEALACGTPVVVRKTGGCPEIVDESCGAVYDTEEIEVLMNLIRKTADRKTELSDMCIRRARLFNKEDMMQQYIDLYMEKVNG